MEPNPLWDARTPTTRKRLTVDADFCACGVLVSEKVFGDLRAEYDDFGEGFDVWCSDEGTGAHLEVADTKELGGYTGDLQLVLCCYRCGSCRRCRFAGLRP